jgi:hypothetical protein
MRVTNSISLGGHLPLTRWHCEFFPPVDTVNSVQTLKVVEGSLIDVGDDQYGDQFGTKYRLVNMSNGHKMLYFGGSSFGWNVRCTSSTEIYTRGCHWFPRLAFAPLEASRCVTDDIPLGCPLPLIITTVNSVQTLKGAPAYPDSTS